MSDGGGARLTFLLTFCRCPFSDIKIAALKLLRVICGDSWGEQALADTAGFVEFLLDRRVEFDKEAVQEKYLVIKKLADKNVDDEMSVFDAATRVNLKKYIAEGAFYVTGIVEVAVDGQD